MLGMLFPREAKVFISIPRKALRHHQQNKVFVCHGLNVLIYSKYHIIGFKHLHLDFIYRFHKVDFGSL